MHFDEGLSAQERRGRVAYLQGTATDVDKVRVHADLRQVATIAERDGLGWVDELKKVDTKQIEPMLSVFNESMVMRKDEVSSEISDELVLKNAPESKSGFFVVPKVVE